MMYYTPERSGQEICLVQKKYEPQFELKTESVFAQCNGYLGVRAAGGFPSLDGKRGMFVAGFFHRAYKEEVTELVNGPDAFGFRLKIDGEEIGPDRTDMPEYERRFNIHTGELMIKERFCLKSGSRIKVTERRFASVENPHLLVQKVKISMETGKIVKGELLSGIDAQQTNSGVSHFCKVDCRVYERRFIHVQGYLEKDALSLLAVCQSVDGQKSVPVFTLARRGILGSYQFEIEENGCWEFEKYIYVQKQSDQVPLDQQKEYLKKCKSAGYESVLDKHKNVMCSRWKKAAIQIQGASLEEEAAIAFAQYHLMGMMPWNNSKSSVAAKGLTGEGYKGHVFWDTELFILPFFQYVFPEQARNLLDYRYRGLEGARAKAREYGYQGAMYPWEAASSGKEETPLYAALNIHTGKATKVWSGIKEHHVTADIVYAIWQYYSMTGDEMFMNQHGYEMIFEAAAFWVSRAVWDEARDAWVILDVIGPDEYTEHVDNNAYTNYMAHYCVSLAVKLTDKVEQEQPELCHCLQIGEKKKQWMQFVEKLYLPQLNQEQILPQDDTFLSKKCLPNIEKYRTSQIKQSVLKDYSRDEVVDMQVLKQADTVMLLNLFPQMFSPKTVKKNVLFYESRTIHDSSLSYCAHAQACAAIGESEIAWKFFQKCMVIDLDENPNDSEDGIHAASMGGIWTCVVFGFAGLSFADGALHLNPRLPKHWTQMDFYVQIRGRGIHIRIRAKELWLKTENTKGEPLQVQVGDQKFILKEQLHVEYAKGEEKVT